MLVKFTSYPSDPRICEITTLRMYCTGCKRGKQNALFISRKTISKGIMVAMHRSGENVDLFRPHNTSAAATSKVSVFLFPMIRFCQYLGGVQPPHLLSLTT